MKKIAALLLAVMLLSSCSSATLNGAGKELEDTIANVTNADNRYVQMVKGGYRMDDPELTYEEAFSAFFATPRWKYFESEDGQKVVEFTGDCTYQDTPVKARIQFVVDEENGTFDTTYLAFNEVPQTNLILGALIAKAFEEAEAAGISSNKASTASNLGELYYMDTPLTNLLGCSSERLYDLFGDPTAGTSVNGELLYGGTEFYIFNDNIGFYMNSATGTVAWITADANAVKINETTLDKNRDGIISLLGNPDTEEDVNDESGEGFDGHYMQYVLSEKVVVSVEMADVNSKADGVTLSLYSDSEEDDTNYDDYYDDYSSVSLDSALVGRWRSANGGTLEFSSDGSILSSDFNCWSLVGDTPDRVLCESYNGRVTCSAYFDDTIEYSISEEDGEERLVFTNNPNHRYRRTAGTVGGGLTGTWNSMTGMVWSFQFNEDGTGMYNGTYPITWWRADTETNELSYTMLDTTYFDYSVMGNMLTVFLSDGSRVYTKVGS